MHNILIQFLSFRGIYICLKKKGKPTLKKKIVFLFRFLRATNRRDKIYASIRIASPRPTIVRNDNVSQINFPAIIPESVTSHDLTAHRSHPYPQTVVSFHRSTPAKPNLAVEFHPFFPFLNIVESGRRFGKLEK